MIRKNVRLFGLREKTQNQMLHDNRHIKTKIRTYRDKSYTNFHGFNVPEDDIGYEIFEVIYIDSLVVYKEKCYLQVLLDNYAYKIVNKQTKNYLDENLFENWTL